MSRAAFTTARGAVTRVLAAVGVVALALLDVESATDLLSGDLDSAGGAR